MEKCTTNPLPPSHLAYCRKFFFSRPVILKGVVSDCAIIISTGRIGLKMRNII